jgi:TonB family protein
MKLAAIVAVTTSLTLCPAVRSAAVWAQENNQPVYESKDVSVQPVLIEEAKPKYTPDAMREGVEGSILLEGVVQTNGTVTDIRVVRALRPDLDAEAVKSFEKWRFKPGQNDARAVAVRISVAVAFSLGERPDPVYEVGGAITAPTLLTEVKPVYPDADREAGRTGVVGLECVVRRNGVPSDIVVTKRLYPSLDEAAVAALKQWRFKPGARGQTDVSVRIQLTMSFDLR